MPTPTPAPTPADTNPAHSLAGYFRDLIGFDLNAVISLADPEIRKEARVLAEKAKIHFPDGHWFRSELVSRAFAVLSSRMETAAASQSQSVKKIAEKISDFLDIFGEHFFDRGSNLGTEKTHVTKSTDTFAFLEERFLKRAEEAIAKARTDNKVDEVQKALEAEFKALTSIRKLVEKELDAKTVKVPAHPQTSHLDSMGKSLRPLNTALEKRVRRWKAENRKSRKALKAPRKSTWLGKILDTPWVIGKKMLLPE